MGVNHTASLVYGIPVDIEELRNSPQWNEYWEKYVQNPNYYDEDCVDVVFGIETCAVTEGDFTQLHLREPKESTMNDYLDVLETLGISYEPRWFMLNVVH